MGRGFDPFTEAVIQFVIDHDCIGPVWLALHRGNDIAIDPVMDHPEADAISLTNLTHVQGSLRRLRSLNAVFVSQPFYHAGRKGLACWRAYVAFAA
jgi:hypothetical protein